MIVSFIGDNAYMREQAARDYVQGFVGLHGGHAIDRFAAEESDPAHVMAALSTAPFLSQRRMVILSDLSQNKALSDSFEQLVAATADTTDFVIIESRVDGRSKYLQQLKKLADTREFMQLDAQDLAEWLVAEAKQKHATLSLSDANYIIERVGANQQLLSNELAKLVAYNSRITRENIDLLTEYMPQSSIFAMLEAAFGGDAARAVALYKEQRVQGMEPQAVLGMIAWQLHILALVKTAQSKPPNELAAEAKLNPFVVRKSQLITNRLPYERLVMLIGLATETDAKLKTTKINADNAVSTLLLACSQ